MKYWVAEGFVPGAVVEVASERIKGRRGIKPFKYRTHALNNITGSEWVDVFDAVGAPWSFPIKEISLPKPKRKRKKK